MKSNRIIAITVGVLIIAAYSVIISVITDSVPLIIIFEALSGIEVIAISILLLPLLKTWGRNLTIWYLIGKILEGALLIIAAFILFSNSTILLTIRELIYLYHAYFLIASSAILYVLLYKSKLVPRIISVWGIVSLVLLLIGNLLELAGNTHPMIALFYPMIMLNEFFLAIWLIVKGFNIIEMKTN